MLLKKYLVYFAALVTVFFVCCYFYFTWDAPTYWDSSPSTSRVSTDSTDASTIFIQTPSSLSVDKMWTESHSSQTKKYSSTCRKWGVVSTTEDTISVAVSRFLKLEGWCIVVSYSSRSKKPEYHPQTADRAFGEKKGVVYLNADKNAAYLYAISRGATAIWDFDDNHMLKYWIKNAAPRGAPSLDGAATMQDMPEMDAVTPSNHSWPTYNPYAHLGAPALLAWPRGLPLDDIRKGHCSNAKTEPVTAKSKSIAVLQSLSDYRPDVDDMCGSLVSTPFYFTGTQESRPLMVPNGVFAPYNSQSTLHFQPAFWALYLPVTVDAQIRDIWRSYIAQRLFWDAGLMVGFLHRPLVIHRSDGDTFKAVGNPANIVTSSRTQRLVKYLMNWKSAHKVLSQRAEQLWRDLHQEGYVGRQDVKMIKEWLQQLARMNYTFPALNEDGANMNTINSQHLVQHYMDPQDDEETATWLQNLLSSKDRKSTVHICAPNAIPKAAQHACFDKPFTFWTSDLHFGTRMDVPSVLAAWGQKVILAIGDKENRHPEVWQHKGIKVYERVSDLIRNDFASTRYMNTRLTEQMVQGNFEFYKSDPLIESTDAFFCLFQPGMCEMWMPFNRTIIFIPAHRYSMGRCTKEEFVRLNEHLIALATLKNPKHIIAASSTYDLEQLRHYTGLDVLPLFSYCGYYVGNYTYNPTREEIPIFVRTKEFWNDGFKSKIKKFKIVDVKELYPWFQFSDLVKHRAVIYLPYAVMSYKITELYALNIPLFFPSMKYLQTIKDIGADRSILAYDWCGGGYRSIGNIQDSEMEPHPCSTHPYSPNLWGSQHMEAEYYWMQFADFFEWPHITYFDDFEDLERKLELANFTVIHSLMVEENKRREQVLYQNWCHVLNKMQMGQKVPQDYAQAIKALYNVSRLQVY